ncbi:MAG: crossover junction endodeoxyribonuclease RuvC [Candidatus Komeilibacteria bacterium]|nr:crossover junction endodeoxyribonuclease RuvC [Candidatus Komeilibacteria bacterium]
MPTSKSTRTPITILGIDPGFADTGYAVIRVHGQVMTYIACGSITSSPREIFSDRLLLLEAGLEKILNKFKPTLVAVEKIFFAQNVTTGITVAHARGVILLTIARHHTLLAEYTPLEVKQSLTSYGHATKPQVGQMVKTLLKLSSLPQQDDAVDALAIAICAHFRNKTWV